MLEKTMTIAEKMGVCKVVLTCLKREFQLVIMPGPPIICVQGRKARPFVSAGD